MSEEKPNPISLSKNELADIFFKHKRPEAVSRTEAIRQAREMMAKDFPELEEINSRMRTAKQKLVLRIASLLDAGNFDTIVHAGGGIDDDYDRVLRDLMKRYEGNLDKIHVGTMRYTDDSSIYIGPYIYLHSLTNMLVGPAVADDIMRGDLISCEMIDGPILASYLRGESEIIEDKIKTALIEYPIPGQDIYLSAELETNKNLIETLNESESRLLIAKSDIEMSKLEIELEKTRQRITELQDRNEQIKRLQQKD